jgi:hypothetical protein
MNLNCWPILSNNAQLSAILPFGPFGFPTLNL